MLGMRKEKNVLDLIEKHLDKIEECLKTAMETIEHYIGDNIQGAKSAALKTDHLETETDEIRREVEELLFSGAFLPNLRQDIHVLVEQLDKIADKAEACCDMVLGQRPEIPEGFKGDFLEMARESWASYDPLKIAVLSLLSEKKVDIEFIRERIKEVGIKESDVDDLEWKLTRRVFTSDLPLANKLHLQHWLEKITEISDRAEDASDWVSSLIFKTRI